MTTYSWLQAARLCAGREPDLDIQPQVLLDLLVEGVGEPWSKPFPGNAIMHELPPARALRGARIELRMRPPFTSAQRPLGIALVLSHPDFEVFAVRVWYDLQIIGTEAELAKLLAELARRAAIDKPSPTARLPSS